MMEPKDAMKLSGKLVLNPKGAPSGPAKKKTDNKIESNKKSKHKTTSSSTTTSSSPGCSESANGDIIGIRSSETICVEWIPGIGYSKECDKDATKTLGGGVCNLVSKAWLEALMDAHDVDLVLNQAGLCRADIVQGDVTLENVVKVLPSGYQIVLVETTGEHIVDALEQAANAAYKGNASSYPYGSGIRFKVDYKREANELFVYDVEVNSGLRTDWDTIILSQNYLVATNEIMAGEIDASNRVDLNYTDIELFMEYAKTVCVLEDPPVSEYSTQYFDGINHLISTQAAYSCLQDDSLCNCGFC
jgi:hypothetical protein